MEFAEVCRRRHMVRSFAPGPVAPASLERILAAARRAPSAGNTKGWALVVLQGEETARFWESTSTEEWRRASRRWRGLEPAPAVVVILTRPGAYAERYAEPDKADPVLGAGTDAWPVPYWFTDCGGLATLMLCAAVDEGLAACFLGNFRREEALLDALGVPDGWRYVGAVVIGTPADEDPPSPSVSRVPVATDLVFHRRWENNEKP